MPDQIKKEVPNASFVYKLVRRILRAVLYIFFQEIEVAGKENVPTKGPVIFVGNHPNQFVDGMMMFTKSPRDVFLLIAESSLKKYALAGFFAKLQHAIPVYRREDFMRVGKGEVEINHSEEWELHLKTENDENIKPGDIINIPLPTNTIFNEKSYHEIQFIIKAVNNTNLLCGSLLPEYVEFIASLPNDFFINKSFGYKILPKLNQNDAYDAIFTVLARGDCIGVFPEGGSSDQTQLRKLKVGVAYIALSLKKKYPNLPVTIVPCGLNYISGHRFRSKSMLEFGSPLVVTNAIVNRFCQGDKEAVEVLTEQISSRLRSVTLNIPEYISGMLHISPFEAREIITVCRRLYQPPSVKLPVSKYLELNRRFANGIAKMSSETKIQTTLEEIRKYNADRRALSISDRQVENSPKNWRGAVFGAIYLISHIFLLIPCLLALPCIILHLPIAAITKYKALEVAHQSAKKSDVKIDGRDVIASTKIAVGFVVSIVFYLIYGLIGSILLGWIYLPVVIVGLLIYTILCIRYLDSTAATFRSAITLARFLFFKKYRAGVKELRTRRMQLRDAVVSGVKEYGPRFNEYWDQRVVTDELLDAKEPMEEPTLPFFPFRPSYQHEEEDMFHSVADNLF